MQDPSMKVAALFVHTNGVYFSMRGVDAWDKHRDAMTYKDDHPVVAHPPCSRWCQLAHINQKRYGHMVGDDGGMFARALDIVRKNGGVLEHPAFSLAWPRFDLPKPIRGSWLHGNRRGEWVTEISQSAYGHRARKRTWLLFVGRGNVPFDMNWSEPAPRAQVSFCRNHGNSQLPRLSKKEASATPIELARVLVKLARST